MSDYTINLQDFPKASTNPPHIDNQTDQLSHQIQHMDPPKLEEILL